MVKKEYIQKKHSLKFQRLRKEKQELDGAGRPSERILVLDLQTNISTEYESISYAAKTLNIPKSRISMYFSRNQNKPFKGRYVFKKL